MPGGTGGVDLLGGTEGFAGARAAPLPKEGLGGGGDGFAETGG